MKRAFLGIDVGTYSSKGVLTDGAGTVLAQRSLPHEMEVPKPGWAEQDADAVWWHDTVQLAQALSSQAGELGVRIEGVGVSAIGPCLLPLGRDGRPLRKGILYGVDTRATAEGEELAAEIGHEALLRHAKMTFTSQAIGPKILWLRRHEPEVWNRTATLTTASSYLVHRLTGEHVIDRHTASHFMPFMNMETLSWSERYAELVAPLAMLPRLGWSDERAGTVSAEAARETGLPAGTPVAVGAVDALSEALSAGVRQVGDLMVMYGSTAFFIQLLERPVVDERVWSTAGAFAGQYALAAGMATTGSVTRWWHDLLHGHGGQVDENYAALFAAAKEVPPGARGLMMLPYFSGERTPINDPLARGVLAGLHLGHGRAEVFRAALEGVAHGIRHNLETFREIGAPAERIFAVGGGTRDRFWPQIVSDVAGVDQIVPQVTVGAAWGDAFLGACAAGAATPEDLADWTRAEAVVRPDPAAQAVHDRLHPHFRALYQDTRAVVHALATDG